MTILIELIQILIFPIFFQHLYIKNCQYLKSISVNEAYIPYKQLSYEYLFFFYH